MTGRGTPITVAKMAAKMLWVNRKFVYVEDNCLARCRSVEKRYVTTTTEQHAKYDEIWNH